jgi:uncharacterized coiled-coil DUF342 family protein
MFDLESYERQVNDNNKVVQDLKDQIEQHCKTIDQKDKEIRRHKREKDDVRKEVKITAHQVVDCERTFSTENPSFKVEIITH